MSLRSAALDQRRAVTARRRWRGLALGLASLLLVACSTVQVAYDHADFVVRWQVSRFVKMTPEQRQQWDAAFRLLWLWHRRTQLPEYATTLRQLSSDIGHGSLSPAQVTAYSDRAEALTEAIYTRGEPALTAFLVGFSDEQTDTLLAHMRKDVDKTVKRRSEKTPEERHLATVRSMSHGLRFWLGDLTDEQKRLVEHWADALPERSPEEQSQLAKDWIDHLAALMGSRHQPGFEARLHEFVTAPYDAAHSREDEDQRHQWLTLLAQLSGMLTSEQREHLRGRLDGIAQDFDVLSRKPAS